VLWPVRYWGTQQAVVERAVRELGPVDDLAVDAEVEVNLVVEAASSAGRKRAPREQEHLLARTRPGGPVCLMHARVVGGQAQPPPGGLREWRAGTRSRNRPRQVFHDVSHGGWRRRHAIGGERDVSHAGWRRRGEHGFGDGENLSAGFDCRCVPDLFQFPSGLTIVGFDPG